MAGECTVAGGGGGYWGIDTETQWRAALAAQNAGCDVWSIHHYEDATGAGCWFSPDRSACVRNASGVIGVVADEAERRGTLVFVGEYGAAAPNFTGPFLKDQAFPDAVLHWQVGDTHSSSAKRPRQLRTLSSIWSWACPSKRASMRCIWPTVTLNGSVRATLHPGEEGGAHMLALLQGAHESTMRLALVGHPHRRTDDHPRGRSVLSAA